MVVSTSLASLALDASGGFGFAVGVGVVAWWAAVLFARVWAVGRVACMQMHMANSETVLQRPAWLCSSAPPAELLGRTGQQVHVRPQAGSARLLP